MCHITPQELCFDVKAFKQIQMINLINPALLQITANYLRQTQPQITMEQAIYLLVRQLNI